MKHHDLKRMINEAGGGQSRHPEKWDIWEFNNDAVERFAEIVAAAEREACAQISAEWLGPVRDREFHIAEAIRARGEE
jgi:hypothetical protein